MNRVIEAKCALVDVLEWGRRNGVPICMVLYLSEHFNWDVGNIHGSRKLIERYHMISRIRHVYRFLIRDRDLDLLTLYLGNLRVLR